MLQNVSRWPVEYSLGRSAEQQPSWPSYTVRRAASSVRPAGLLPAARTVHEQTSIKGDKPKVNRHIHVNVEMSHLCPRNSVVSNANFSPSQLSVITLLAVSFLNPPLVLQAYNNPPQGSMIGAWEGPGEPRSNPTTPLPAPKTTPANSHARPIVCAWTIRPSRPYCTFRYVQETRSHLYHTRVGWE